MKRKLFLLLCVISTVNAIAQVRNSPPAGGTSPNTLPAGSTSPKITEKQAEPKQAGPKIDYKTVGAPMASLILLAPKDSALVRDNHLKPYITNEDLENKANLFVMMFNPTCSHCQDETLLLEKNIALFKKSKIVLVANKGMTSYLPDFMRQFKIMDYPCMQAGIDSTNFIDNTYLYGALPQIDIFDKHRKLIKVFAGEVVIDSLEKYIQ
jgi:thiol-disulfide isomerase/thioredoxin